MPEAVAAGSESETSADETPADLAGSGLMMWMMSVGMLSPIVPKNWDMPLVSMIFQQMRSISTWSWSEALFL